MKLEYRYVNENEKGGFITFESTGRRIVLSHKEYMEMVEGNIKKERNKKCPKCAKNPDLCTGKMSHENVNECFTLEGNK